MGLRGAKKTRTRFNVGDIMREESVCVTEYSDEKSSIGETEPEVKKRKSIMELPRQIVVASTWNTRLTFSSFRRPTASPNKSKPMFRFTISGRHQRDNSCTDSAITQTASAVRLAKVGESVTGCCGGGGDVMRKPEVRSSTPETGPAKPPGRSTSTENCFRGREADDMTTTTRLLLGDVGANDQQQDQENVDRRGSTGSLSMIAGGALVEPETAADPTSTTGGVFDGMLPSAAAGDSCDNCVVTPTLRGIMTTRLLLTSSSSSLSSPGFNDIAPSYCCQLRNVETAATGSPDADGRDCKLAVLTSAAAAAGETGSERSENRRPVGEVRFAQLPAASETQETIVSSSGGDPFPVPVVPPPSKLQSGLNGSVVTDGNNGGGGSSSNNNKLAAGTNRKSQTAVVASRQRDRCERREMRATVRMAAIIGVFCAMWIGFFTVYVARGVLGDGLVGLPHWLDAFLFWLGYANSTVNPILYAVFNVDFRRAFQHIVVDCCCCCCCCSWCPGAAGGRGGGGGKGGRRMLKQPQQGRRSRLR
jgi:hypothetical protein